MTGPSAPESDHRPQSEAVRRAADPVQFAGRVGKYDEPLTAIVLRRPGVTVAQAAAQLGVHPTALYPVIRRLETRGQLVKLGRQLQPPNTARGTGGVEGLWCEAGHSWERPRVRGRKPTRCPEHRR